MTPFLFTSFCIVGILITTSRVATDNIWLRVAGGHTPVRAGGDAVRQQESSSREPAGHDECQTLDQRTKVCKVRQCNALYLFITFTNEVCCGKIHFGQ